MTVTISSDVLDRILDHARARPEREVCGLLLGTDAAIEDVVRTRNVATDPAKRFEVDPAAHFAAHRGARAGGLTVVGSYHSHPRGSSMPSATDAAMIGQAGELWLIVAHGAAQLWRAGEGAFDEVAICVTPSLARPESVRQSDVMKRGRA